MRREEIESAVREAAEKHTAAGVSAASAATRPETTQPQGRQESLTSVQSRGGQESQPDSQTQRKSGTLTPALQKARRRRQNALLRNVIQVFFFLMMPGAFVAGFSGVKSIFQKVSEGSVLELNSFVMALIGRSLFTVIFGRFFCGFACAFGTFGDLIYWLSGVIQKKVFRRKKQYSLPERLSPWFQKVKFVILALIVLTCATGGYDALAQYNWNPWSVFSFITALRFNLNGYLIGAVILAAIIVEMALKERFFCQFLCPMGAVFAILPQLPFAWLQRNEDNCIKNCRACQTRCPVDIKLETDGFRNGECIGCEKCAGVCPKGNLTRWDRTLLKNEMFPVLIRAALLFLLGIYLGLCRFL